MMSATEQVMMYAHTCVRLTRCNSFSFSFNKVVTRDSPSLSRLITEKRGELARERVKREERKTGQLAAVVPPTVYARPEAIHAPRTAQAEVHIVECFNRLIHTLVLPLLFHRASLG